MPQLNLTWWIINFIIIWIAFTIVTSIIVNTNTLNITSYNKTTNNQTPNSEWKWY